jgi:putative transposase
MAESFFAALKNERVHRTAYPTRAHAHARADITRYIEFWYNRNRLHSGLDYKSPQEVLNQVDATPASGIASNN